MESKAFTLIELLAVIVILAIIALIATPIVLGIINDAREDAKMRSIENYSKAAANALLKKQLDGSVVPDGTYTLNPTTGQVCNSEQEPTCLIVEVDGMKPVEYTMEVLNGKITSETVRLKTGDPSYTKTGNGSFIKNGEPNTNEEPQAPSITVTAATAETKTTGNVPAGNYAAGDEYIIHIGGQDRIFFVLGTNGNNVDLIMNKNIGSNGSNVLWISKEDYIEAGGEDLSNDGGGCEYIGICAANTYGPITANAYLASQTSSWEVAPQLPTITQMTTAGCTTTVDSCPTWLSDYTALGTHTQDTQGYWTSSTSTDYSTRAWAVVNTQVNVADVDMDVELMGVRPVITISKTLLD